MKTILLLSVLPASLVAMFAIAPAGDIPYGSMGAVGALGATLLLLVGKYLPTRDKQFTEAIVKVTDRFAKSVDDAGERSDKLVREIILKEEK